MTLFDYFGQGMMYGFVIGLVLSFMGAGLGIMISTVRNFSGCAGPVPTENNE